MNITANAVENETLEIPEYESVKMNNVVSYAQKLVEPESPPVKIDREIKAYQIGNLPSPVCECGIILIVAGAVLYESL